MRSNHYDTLGQNIALITGKREHQSNILQKSDNPTAIIKDFAEDEEQITAMYAIVYSQFNSLKQDFYAGKIQESRYREQLQELKTLLTSGEKITNPVLNAPEMAAEISRYVGG